MPYKRQLITASLTTIPDRTESLKDTVKSLLPQVDKLNVYLHGYTEMPQFLKHKKIEVAFDLERGDRGDIDKMSWCDEVKGYHLICDDDLIYPPDYAIQMVRSIDKYKRKAIVSYHGSILKRLPIAKYYEDRIVYPCLLTVEQDQEMSIIGTGTLGYHSSVGIGKIELGDKLPNMLDIHISLWAKEKKIPLYVLAHKEGWIKHSEKVDLNKTIFATHSTNDWVHTQMINSRPELFGSPKPMLKDLPIISIVIVNSRGRKHPEWLQECLNSVRGQSYYNIQPIIVENTDRLITIGKAFNEGVKEAKGEWVLFLGDDDWITPDYVSALVSYAYYSGDTKSVCVTTFLTMFHSDGKEVKREPRELAVTGMWRKDYLLEYPACEFLTRYVDTDMMSKTEERGDKMATLRWHYGYFYRSHLDQVSGFKQLALQNKYASWRTDEVKEKLLKLKSTPVNLEVKND